MQGEEKRERVRQKEIARNDEQMRLILAETKATTQAEKDVIHLKQIALSIRPYSCWWRWGYLGSLRRAIKILEERRKNDE